MREKRIHKSTKKYLDLCITLVLASTAMYIPVIEPIIVAGVIAKISIMIATIKITHRIWGIDNRFSENVENIPIPSPNNSIIRKPAIPYSVDTLKPIFLPSFNPSLAVLMVVLFDEGRCC